MSLTSLQPQILWKNFEKLNAVPRPSKKEERVISFIKDFAENLQLYYQIDKAGNVLIKKAATKDMQTSPTIVLQSHLDMVHQKNSNTSFDFNTQGIQMYVEGDWVKAKGTTLGADNGIGVAAMMALLESKDISHPPLEALFTVDEETGMTGAIELEKNFISGKILLNLDTEDDDELTIGCAGGLNVNVEGSYEEENVAKDSQFFHLSIKGLTGGHSGMDIHRGRANANKLMNRMLWQIKKQANFQICKINGGGLRNVIPRESEVVFAVKKQEEDNLRSVYNKMKAILESEYSISDPRISIELNETQGIAKCMNAFFQRRLLQSIYSVPYGILRMSPDMPNKVQTSNNLAQISANNSKFEAVCLIRSSVDSEKQDVFNSIEAAFAVLDVKVLNTGSYPGWTPKPQSKIVDIMADLYRESFHEEPNISACHAGLECGIIGSKYPEMDMISFGPNIRGAHSPDEKVQISSVQKFWDFFLESLKRIVA